VSVPEPVIGEPLTENSAGLVSATDVTFVCVDQTADSPPVVLAVSTPVPEPTGALIVIMFGVLVDAFGSVPGALKSVPDVVAI
jgi:hypothetical protein